MTLASSATFYGWTENQYRLAAQSCNCPFDEDWFANAYVAAAKGLAADNQASAALREIKHAWLRRGGPIAGPSGAITLPHLTT